jgi:Flp pilus assembly protein TadG
MARRPGTSGNVTILFALSAPVLLLGIGMAIDFSRAASVRTKLNGVADAAALFALTPAMLQQNPSAAQTAAVSFFKGQAATMTDLVPGSVNATVTITASATSSLSRVVNLTYSAQTRNFFGGLEPSSTFQIGGSSTATASIPPNIDFYLLLDNSPSMSLPATSAGVALMQTLTPDQGACAFACHQASTNNGDTADNPCLKGAVYSTPTLAGPPPSTTAGKKYCAASQGTQIDDFGLARLNGIKLRLDELASGVTSLMTIAANTAASGQYATPPNYRFAAYSMDSLWNLPSSNTLWMALTANYRSAWATASASFGVMQMWSNSNGCANAACTSGVAFNDVATNYDIAMSSIKSTMPTPGAGTNTPGDSPQIVLFLVTDGVEDEQNGIRLIQPINAGTSHNYCNDIKARGIKIAVLYTEYLPLPTNSFYNNNVKPFQSQIGPALSACASPGLYYDAGLDADLGVALATLFQSVTQSATLTK